MAKQTTAKKQERRQATSGYPYQGREMTITLQAPTLKSLNDLVKDIRAYARANNMDKVKVLEKGRDPDGGWRATVTAHNWNPVKWAREKFGKLKKAWEARGGGYEGRMAKAATKSVREGHRMGLQLTKGKRQAEAYEMRARIERAKSATHQARQARRPKGGGIVRGVLSALGALAIPQAKPGRRPVVAAPAVKAEREREATRTLAALTPVEVATEMRRMGLDSKAIESLSGADDFDEVSEADTKRMQRNALLSRLPEEDRMQVEFYLDYPASKPSLSRGRTALNHGHRRTVTRRRESVAGLSGAR